MMKMSNTHAETAPLLRSIKATASRLGLGVSTVWKLIAQGRLETIKIGRRTLVKETSIEKLAEGSH
jgi:excisionase family DNA binding protein